MNVERTISARRVEVKPSSTSLSATVTATAPRVVTLHERFSQLPKVEPKRAEVADLNLFQEAGIRSRRQATEQRQGTQREMAVAARRSISTTWTPSFDDDDNDNGARARVSVGGRHGRQFEFDQPREPAFVIKGIPPPQPSSRQQRAVVVQHQQTVTMTRSASRGGGGGRSTVVRGGRIIEALPRGNTNNHHNQRPVIARGGRGSRGGAVVAAPGNNQRRAPVTAVGARGGRGGRGGAAARGGGRGGARGGKANGGAAAAAKPPSKDALDAELDSYMLQTPESAKSYLDQQLEDYMHAREQESASSSSS